VVQAAQQITTGSRRFSPGPWDEDLFWLSGAEAVDAPIDGSCRNDFSARHGGCHTLRATSGFAFIRAGSFRHRPSQADALHVDLWWNGNNIALDPGTYSYNSPAPWDNSLGSTAFHNTVGVDGLDQMKQAGRFLWMPWLNAELSRAETSTCGQIAYREAWHDGYQRLSDPVTHRRGVLRLGPEHWLIVDKLNAKSNHDYSLHWLLCDSEHQWDSESSRINLRTADGPYQVQVVSTSTLESSLVRADPDTPRGWCSAHYLDHQPALSCQFEMRGSTVRCWTLFGPGNNQMLLNGRGVFVDTGSWTAKIDSSDDPMESSGNQQSLPLLSSIAINGAITDKLEL